MDIERLKKLLRGYKEHLERLQYIKDRHAELKQRLINPQTQVISDMPRGMCDKCYHHNVVKPKREKQKQKECGVDGKKDKQRKNTVSNAVQIYFNRNRAD